MEENKVTFEEKLTRLVELGKNKKNVLENKEILEFFHGEILSPEQLDTMYEVLEGNRIDVLQFDGDIDIDPDLFIEEELNEEEELEVDEEALDLQY